jgi:hypothetical protein
MGLKSPGLAQKFRDHLDQRRKDAARADSRGYVLHHGILREKYYNKIKKSWMTIDRFIMMLNLNP